MASGPGARQVYNQVLSAVVTHKQESLQYLTVDSDTYLQWRTLARSLELTTDCEVASFLLQHYEKTSAMALTQCVKCCGSLVQYCVPCNIYMSQPTASSLLEQEGGAPSDEAIMAGETILIDFTDVESTQSMADSQQLVMVKTNDLNSVDMGEERGEVMSSNQLEALVEACAMQGAIVTETPATLLEPHTATTSTTITTTATATKSLLTPEVLRKLKSQSVRSGVGPQVKMEAPVTYSLVTSTEDQQLTSSPVVTASQLTASGVPTLTSQQPVTTVVSGEGQTTGQDEQPGDSTSVTELAQQVAPGTAAPVLSPPGTQSEDLSRNLYVLPKSSLSEDESDYYCAPLFKREKVDDEDLQMAINILEGKVSTSDTEPPADVSIMVTQDVAQASSVGQSAGVDAKKTCHTAKLDSTVVEVDVSDAVNTALETNKSAAVDEKTKALTNPGSETSEWTTPELDSNDGTTTDIEESKPSMSDKEASESASPERQPRSSGRKRKTQSPSPDPNWSPQPSPQKETPQVVSHTMRTRFFDKKRPSFVSPSPSMAQSPSKRGSSKASGRRGRRPGNIGKEQHDQKQDQSRGKKKGMKDSSSEDDTSDDDENDDVLDSDEEEAVKHSDQNKVGKNRQENIISLKQERSTGKNTGCRSEGCSESTEMKEKKPDLKNQVIVITDQEQLEKLILPQTRPQNPSTIPESKIKIEGCTMPVVKLETNIAPLDFEPLESMLASKVSIVTDGNHSEGFAPRKKRRLHFKKVGKNYACDMCEEQMGSRSELKQHLQQQHGSRPYACSKCPATYKNRSHLRVHLNRHAEVKPFQCPKCPKNFASNYALTAHLTTHSTDRPEVCDVCGRTFKSAKYLKGHKLLHQPGEKRFICQQCGTRFSRKSNLLNHIKIHNNDKQFECPHCHRRFIQSGSLKSHVFRMHNPNRARPYVCDICGEARYAKDQFEKHMMIHTGTKPFKCEVCGAAFVQSNALKGHMKIHTETEGKAHWCYVCGAAFKKFASLKKHCSKIHNEYPEMSIGTLQVIEVQIPS